MTFSDETIRAAWIRARERCECARKTHDHLSGNERCGQELVFTNRDRKGEGAWEAHHKLRGISDALSNCEILCWECHKLTFKGTR